MSNFTTDTSPLADDFDSLKVREPAQPQRLSAVGELVRQVLVAMNVSGEDAEESYQRSVAAVRRHPVEAVIEIARMECMCLSTDYAARSALVYAACELEHRAALPLLKSAVLTPIPAERFTDPRSSTVAEETIIRTTAVDGVATLARQGDKDVIDLLFEFLAVPSISIRRAAVQGLLGSPQGDDLRGRIAECLPKDQRFLLDLKKLDVREAAQIDDPRRHLSEKGREDKKPAAPQFNERGRLQQTGGTSARKTDVKDPGCDEDDNREASPSCG
ncbi:MAG: hypothetical protein ABI614_13890 [Planctomycetota bacterium]